MAGLAVASVVDLLTTGVAVAGFGATVTGAAGLFATGEAAAVVGTGGLVVFFIGFTGFKVQLRLIVAMVTNTQQ
jgi:hypothetical protein